MTGPKVLLTGATGFIGRAVVNRFLIDDTYRVVAAFRRQLIAEPVGVTPFISGEISAETDWTAALIEIRCVIHLANVAHGLGKFDAYDRVNVEGTLNLARQALRAGVGRFIFISSIAVNGIQTTQAPFNEASPINPNSPYALSKWRTEEQLKALFKGTVTELVIIRPPLVYGAGAPANFGRLLQLVSSNIPLPFGSIDNKRSLIAVENLADFIVFCVKAGNVANQLFLVSDVQEVSTPVIVQLVAQGMGKKKILVPVPMFLFKLGATLLKRPNFYTQLCCSLTIDASKAREFGWKSPLNAYDALTQAGRNFTAPARHSVGENVRS